MKHDKPSTKYLGITIKAIDVQTAHLALLVLSVIESLLESYKSVPNSPAAETSETFPDVLEFNIKIVLD